MAVRPSRQPFLALSLEGLFFVGALAAAFAGSWVGCLLSLGAAKIVSIWTREGGRDGG